MLWAMLPEIKAMMMMISKQLNVQNGTIMPKVSCYPHENVGGSEKSRLVCGAADWFKHVLLGYDEPAGCPWA